MSKKLLTRILTFSARFSEFNYVIYEQFLFKKISNYHLNLLADIEHRISDKMGVEKFSVVYLANKTTEITQSRATLKRLPRSANNLTFLEVCRGCFK